MPPAARHLHTLSRAQATCTCSRWHEHILGPRAASPALPRRRTGSAAPEVPSIGETGHRPPDGTLASTHPDDRG